MNIKCLFGFHDWRYWERLEETFNRRTCCRCGKQQIGECGRYYGETIWVNE